MFNLLGCGENARTTLTALAPKFLLSSGRCQKSAALCGCGAAVGFWWHRGDKPVNRVKGQLLSLGPFDEVGELFLGGFAVGFRGAAARHSNRSATGRGRCQKFGFSPRSR